jgi:protein phosphatase
MSTHRLDLATAKALESLPNPVFRAFGASDCGPVRQVNEDCFAIDEQMGLCVVADGMGGHKAGDVAARVAIDSVLGYIRGAAGRPPAWPFGFEQSLSQAGNTLRTAILVANANVLELATLTPGLTGMGTTVVAALVRHDRLSVAHVGDSRLYLRAGRTLRLLTEDDTLPAMRNVLTNVVGAPAAAVHVAEETLRAGDLLVLVTDGVHGAVDHASMERLMATAGDPQAIAGKLVETALARHSRDNCTAVVAECLA